MPNKIWTKIEANGFDKVNFPTVKKLIFGILAGFFVGIGFTSMIIIVKFTGDPGLGKFFGGVIFCVGILMCMFVGANLYTANCSIYSCVLKKTVKRRYFYYDLLITLIGNWIGSILIAAFIYGIGILDASKDIVKQIAQDKVNLDWWKTFLSGIITNVLVVACVISMVAFENKIIGFFATLIMITAFAICGFQHVVANQFITAIGGFYGDFDTPALVGKVFYNCLLCSGLGNFVGGVGLILMYWLALDKFNTKKPKVTTTIKEGE